MPRPWQVSATGICRCGRPGLGAEVYGVIPDGIHRARPTRTLERRDCERPGPSYGFPFYVAGKGRRRHAAVPRRVSASKISDATSMVGPFILQHILDEVSGHSAGCPQTDGMTLSVMMVQDQAGVSSTRVDS